MRPLVLASSSPRRAELLQAAGLPFVIRVAAIDETRHEDEPPDAYVRRLALAKARAAAAAPHELVLGADTVVVAGAACLGKPLDTADAAAMIRLLAGRSHEVLTGVALVRGGAAVAVAVAATRVTFGPMSEADVAWYVATPEPYDKAGGYAVQGLASRFVTGIDGSYANVVGLPVELVCRLVEAAGEDLLGPS
ncbi:MAG: Maf family protein [Vicinamibacteraceae bacterium]